MNTHDLHHRRSIRLPGFDYSLPGAYFITLVSANRANLFGEIFADEMALNPFGRVVWDEWIQTPILRPEIGLGAFVVMPNHFHGIIHILEDDSTNQNTRTPTANPVGADAGWGTARRAPTVEQFGSPVPNSIPTIVRSFKSAVTKRINEMRGTPGMPVWQRNYYERVIRTDNEYLQIEKYILENPLNWGMDSERGQT